MIWNCPSRWLILAAVCLLVSGGAHGQGKGQGVQVRAVSRALQDIEPGRIVSPSFAVTNCGERTEEFVEILTLPAPWEPIIPATTFTLRPAETTTRIQAFQVPANAAAGRHEVTYGVRSQRDYAIQDAGTVLVLVLAATKLQLLVEEKPESVVAGETYQARLRLINQGNAELKLKLEATSEENCPATIEPAEATMSADQSVVVVLTVKTYGKEGRPRTSVVRVTAQGLKDDKTRASVAVSVGIIPRLTEAPDLYHRLPAQARVLVPGGDGKAGLQAELSGRGTLDEAGTKAVDFLVRAPDAQSRGTFGWRDEYRLNYYTDDLEVRLGDQSYGLSRLTSYYRYGRGLGVGIHRPAGATAFGAYYVRGRWDLPGREEAGLYVSRRVTDRAQVQVNLLHKGEDAYGARPAAADTVWSVETRLRLTPDTSVQAEYGRADSNRDGGVSGDAYRVEGDGRLGRGGYWQLSRIHAGPDYYGYYRDSDYTHGSVTYPVSLRTQAHFSYGRWESNLGLRDRYNTANREKLWQVGVSQSLPGNWYLTLDYDDFARCDALIPADSGFAEKALQLGIGRSQRDYSLRLNLRMGDQQQRLTGESRRAYNWRLFASCHPRPDATFTLYGGFGDDRALRGSRLLRASSDLGATAAWKPTANLNLDLWYSKYNLDSSDRPASDQFGLRVGRALSNGRFLEATVRHTQGERSDDRTLYRLAYTIPFSLRVSRKSSVGVIRGQVYDTRSPGRPGIAGVVLRINGATAVTDRQGRFVFPSVPPGTYAVNVDRGSVGQGRTIEQKLPVAVIAEAGKTTSIELAVTQAASVAGTVLVIASSGNGNGNGASDKGNGTNGNGGFVVGEPGNNDAGRGTTGLANVLVELASGDEILRRATDQRGRFLFDVLRPGQWHLRVYDHNLPAYHYLETPEQDLTLGPGQSLDITIPVLAKARQIKFIDEGVIRPNGNNH